MSTINFKYSKIETVINSIMDTYENTRKAYIVIAESMYYTEFRIVLSESTDDICIRENAILIINMKNVKIDKDHNNFCLNHGGVDYTFPVEKQKIQTFLNNKENVIISDKVFSSYDDFYHATTIHSPPIIHFNDNGYNNNLIMQHPYCENYYDHDVINSQYPFKNENYLCPISDCHLPICILFDIPINSQFVVNSISMTIRSLLFRSDAFDNTKDTKIESETQTLNPFNKHVHYFKFKHSYSQLSFDSSLTIELTITLISKTIPVKTKCFINMFNLDHTLKYGESKLCFPIPNITYLSFNNEKKTIQPNIEFPTIKIQFNSNPNIALVTKKEIEMWRCCGDYATVEDETICSTLKECKKLSIRKHIKSTLVMHLTSYRHYYLKHYFKELGYWVLISTLLTETFTNKALLIETIEFIEHYDILNISLPLVNILPFFAYQTNNELIRQRIGYPLFSKVDVDELYLFFPHLVEILKYERTNFVFEHIKSTIIKEDDKIDKRKKFAEELLWEVANQVLKMNEHYHTFINIFEKLIAIVGKWNPHIINDMTKMYEILCLVDEEKIQPKNKRNDEFSNFQKIKQFNNFKVPFFDGTINEIKKTKQYLSATKPVLVICQVENEKVDRCMMVKCGEDLLKDKLIIILSDFLYRSLQSQIDMKYITYHICEMGNLKGVVEFVPNVLDLSLLIEGKLYDNIFNVSGLDKGNNDNLVKAIYCIEEQQQDKDGKIPDEKRDAILQKITTTPTVRQLNFTKSFAMCCVLNYAFCIRDRHADNYMFQYVTGQIFHIDFGYIFGELVPNKENEQEITRFSSLLQMFDHFHLTQSFYQYAQWAWEKVHENAQNIINIFSFICYDSIDDELMDKVETRLLHDDFNKFKSELTNDCRISDRLQLYHSWAKALKKFVN